MNNKSKVFLKGIVIAAIFFAVLISLTPVVLKLFHLDSDINLIKVNNLESEASYVYYGIDKSSSVDGLFEKYYLQGWAFREDDDAVITDTQAMYANLDKQINVYLRNLDSGNLYQVKTDMISRLDIFRTFSPGVKVNGMYHGFVCSFSSIELPQGEYQVILESIENQACSGIMEIAMFFKKEGHTLREIANPQLGISEEILCDNSVVWGMDGYSFGTGDLSISGWSFNNKYENVNLGVDTVFIRLSNEDGFYDFATNFGRPRTDIAEYYGKGYLNCGFTVDIPMSEVAKFANDGLLNAQIITDNDGQLNIASEKMLVKVDEDQLEGYKSNTEVDADYPEAAEDTVEEESSFNIVDIVAIPLTALMNFCHSILGNYIIAIVVFTLLTKIILLPISMWVHKSGITMVKITPELNRVKIKHYGDRDAIDDATQALYKREKYNPLASTVPMIVQIIMLLGVIGAVKNLLTGADSVLTLVPSEAGGFTWLMPLAAGAAALALGLAQNKLSPLQREQGKKEQWMSNGFSIGISLFLGAFVSLGVGIYWIASNLLSIAQQLLLNLMIKPEKYIDYEALEESKKELAGLDRLSAEVSKEDKKREQEDYKRFFSVANKHLVIYSEKSGFYKYYKDVMDFMLKYSNVIIHYVTNDPKDQIFTIAASQPRIKPYYISEKKLITLLMKMDADIVVMTCPDLDRYHLKRSYVRKDIEYVYMFHYPLSTHMVLNTGALDHYDTILCVGDFQFEEIRAAERVYNLPEKKLISAGYGQLEQLYNSYQKMDKVKRDKPKILIAPSWQQDNILDSCIDSLLEQLLSKGYEVVVRPHPEYVKRYKPRMDAIVQRYSSPEIKDLIFELDFTSNDSLFNSDIIISDWSGSAYEFSLVTLKPAVFVNTPPKINNPEYEKLNVEPLEFKLRGEVGIQVDPSHMAGLDQKINELLDNSESYANQIKQIRDKYIANFGRSGEVGGKYILEQLLERQKKR